MATTTLGLRYNCGSVAYLERLNRVARLALLGLLSISCMGNSVAPVETPSPKARAAEAAASEFVELTGSFRENKGRLPWPTSGVVTGTFGTRTHPVYGTKTRSIGIEISTSPMAPVRAVFDGRVERIFAMPGYGTCVMVSHGDYATIYANLSSVNVQQNQRVRAGEGIARTGTSDDPLGAGLFFGLFAESQAVDPAAWLQRR